MAETLVKAYKTEYEATIADGDNLIVEFFDDVATVILTIDFPNGASTVKVQSSTDLKETLQGINGASAVWVDWPYGNVTTTTQVSMIAPNAIKIDNTAGGGNDIHISIRCNLRG